MDAFKIHEAGSLLEARMAGHRCKLDLLQSLRESQPPELPVVPDQVGSAWNRKAQVDVAGINSMEKTIILGECKMIY